MMEQERLEDLSIYYFIFDLFSGKGVNIVDAFPEELLTVPTIAIDTKRIVANLFELGNKTRLLTRTWYIDVFAQNKSQRDDMTYIIIKALEDCIPVYDYNLGFPPVVVPQLGCLKTDTIQADWIRVLPQLVDKMYYRTSITFTAYFTNI